MRLYTYLFYSTVTSSYGWGYRASDQRRWAVLHPACGGRQQSPIAIAARQAIPISIPAMELIGYQNPLPGPLTIANNGHSGEKKLKLKNLKNCSSIFETNTSSRPLPCVARDSINVHIKQNRW